MMDRNLKSVEKEAAQTRIETFRKLILENEDWLIERIHHYAKEQGYMEYTATLREAWRLSISGLSESLLAAIREDHPDLELRPFDEFVGDPIADFGIIEARRHRERGVNLGMFLGFTKYYRQSYKDMVLLAGFDSHFADYCLNLIERFFDRVEIAFCIEWSESDQSKLIEDLQLRNRLMTNEKLRYHTIFESHPHMVFILDKELRLLNLNHAAARRFHAQETPGAHYYSPALKNHMDGHQQPPESGGLNRMGLEELILLLTPDLKSFLIGGGMSQSFEKKVMGQDGARYFNVTFSQVLDMTEKISGVVMVLEDITVQKRAAEELRQAKDEADAANRAKSAFLANMSHELRSPLNAILGYTQLMQRDTSLRPEQWDYLNTINRSGEHLLDLINDVLEISKIEAGHTTLASVTFDLHTLLQDLYNQFRMSTDARNMQFDMVGMDQVPRYVVADENKLRQVLINLLGNAVKFTEEGGIAMRVAMKDGNQSGIRLMVEVDDTGVGIGEDELDKLFRFFEQTASGIQSKSGTGLGLAISRNYVRMMGGDLTVTSRLGEGSTFRFEIDLQVGKESDLRGKPQQRRVIGLVPGQHASRILVVEDNRESRSLLVKLLEQVGFNVREAENGEKAVEIFENWMPDLIWMDIRMPVMDGLEATRRIKASGGGASVKIAALTASAMEEERESILAAGCDDFVRKPYRESEIFHVMAKHLGLKYLYEVEADEAAVAQLETDLSSQRLATLPVDLHDELLKAVRELDTTRILEVVEQIARQDAPIAAVLEKIAGSLDYGRLLALLENNSVGP
jgi:signal transduction histidine kinase/CheY-like chemotaxis protein